MPVNVENCQLQLLVAAEVLSRLDRPMLLDRLAPE